MASVEVIIGIAREVCIEENKKFASAIADSLDKAYKTGHTDLNYQGETIHLCFRSGCNLKKPVGKR